MDRFECFKILGIPQNSTPDIIKASFKKIALQSHPDKVGHLSPNDKISHENIFKQSSQAYRILTGMEKEEIDLFNMSSYDDLFNQWCDPETMDVFANMFTNLTQTMFEKVIHKNIEITYSDFFQNKIITKIFNIYDEHFEASILCSKYPKTSFFVNLNEIEYELIIHFEFIEDDIYTHISHKNKSIDIIYNIGITQYQFYIGIKHTIHYLDGDNIKLIIKPLSLKNIKIKNKGILGGKLIIKPILINPNINDINKLKNDEFQTLCLLLKKLYI
jgi:DnaJ-class molecular chaperone